MGINLVLFTRTDIRVLRLSAEQLFTVSIEKGKNCYVTKKYCLASAMPQQGRGKREAGGSGPVLLSEYRKLLRRWVS